MGLPYETKDTKMKMCLKCDLKDWYHQSESTFIYRAKTHSAKGDLYIVEMVVVSKKTSGRWSLKLAAVYVVTRKQNSENKNVPTKSAETS